MIANGVIQRKTKISTQRFPAKKPLVRNKSGQEREFLPNSGSVLLSAAIRAKQEVQMVAVSISLRFSLT